ncbi:MAG: uracil-DNA glycosylase family protein [Erythrobacter sp.]|jgi:DNA polymerase|nr:uracil-DNA glycosylase family protein [Erythrobacter sp.]
MTAADPDLAREIAAHRAWWALAGVDCDFADDATAWLAEQITAAPMEREDEPRAGRAAASPEPQVEEIAPPPDLLGDSPPATLAAFREWWLEAPGLDAIGPRGRVPARGKAGAALMVLVVHPEEGDTERLLSGPQGRLLDAILAAMGIGPDEAYVASALPRFTPMADCAVEARRGMGEVLSHHIALASPKRIVAFGTGLAALLGSDAKKDYANLPNVHHKPSNVAVLVSGDLESLMSMPRLKAQFWRRFIEWSGEVR